MPRHALALALTLAAGSACAKHEEKSSAPPAADQAAPVAPVAQPALNTPVAQGSAPTPPPDPKEAARASGLLGPADQGAFADNGFGSGSGEGSQTGKPKGKTTPSNIASTGPKAGGGTTTKTTKTSGGGAGPLDDVSPGAGGEGPHTTRSPDKVASGTAVIGEIQGVDGDARDAVRGAVAQHLGAVEKCYRDTLSRAPTIGGQYTIVFFVNPDGTFERAAELANDLHDGTLSSCIVRTFNGIKVGHDVGPTQLKVSVVLSLKPS